MSTDAKKDVDTDHAEPCKACKGRGLLFSKSGWSVGVVCFRCQGSGEEPDPIDVAEARYRAALGEWADRAFPGHPLIAFAWTRCETSQADPRGVKNV